MKNPPIAKKDKTVSAATVSPTDASATAARQSAKRAAMSRRVHATSAFSLGQTGLSSLSPDITSKSKTTSKLLLRHDGTVADGSQDLSLHYGVPRKK